MKPGSAVDIIVGAKQRTVQVSDTGGQTQNTTDDPVPGDKKKEKTQRQRGHSDQYPQPHHQPHHAFNGHTDWVTAVATAQLNGGRWPIPSAVTTRRCGYGT